MKRFSKWTVCVGCVLIATVSCTPEMSNSNSDTSASSADVEVPAAGPDAQPQSLEQSFGDLALQATSSQPQKVSPTSWDFTTLDKNRWKWRFDTSSPSKTDRGALFSLTQDGAIRLTGVRLPARLLTGVQIELEIMKTLLNDEKSLSEPAELDGLELQWTTVEKKDTSSVEFIKDETGPNIWLANVAQSPDWKETVTSLAIQVDVPESKLQGEQCFDVYVKQIRLVQRNQ